MAPFSSTRRGFLKTSALAAASACLPGVVRGQAKQDDAVSPSIRVALTHGDDRADNTMRALEVFRQKIANDIGNRTVIVKPNNVSTDVQISATHADCLTGILEFLKSIGKLSQAVIAESAGTGPTWEGFHNYGYDKVAKKYGVKLLDLDQQEFELIHVFDQKDFRPHAVRASRLLLDRRNYVISAAKIKTHDRVVATLSLKNIVFGAPIKDEGFRWGKGRKAGAKTDKPVAHGSGYRALNFNLFALGQRLQPDLAINDGYDGMEGNGPVGGNVVDHRVCVVSPDWLAADRVGVELMGIDFAKIGYLNFCADAQMGEADLRKIEIVGEPLARHIRQYKLSDSIDRQLIWQTLPEVSQHDCPTSPDWHPPCSNLLG